MVNKNKLIFKITINQALKTNNRLIKKIMKQSIKMKKAIFKMIKNIIITK